MKFIRRLFSLLLAPASLFHAAAPIKPNIVFIFMDDMGYGAIGPVGNTKLRTPNLDQLVKQGRKFTSYYATPVCSMYRASLMKGCYNVRVSITGVLCPDANIGLNPNETTLPEVVKPHGYGTACIGKCRYAF